MFVAKIVWSTDHNNNPVDLNQNIDDLPASGFGPFKKAETATAFCSYSFPDDPDVYEALVCELGKEYDGYVNEPLGVPGWIPAPKVNGSW